MKRFLACTLMFFISCFDVSCADEIHLKDGRVIEVESCWEKSDQVKYEKYGAIVGIDIEIVKEIKYVEVQAPTQDRKNGLRLHYGIANIKPSTPEWRKLRIGSASEINEQVDLWKAYQLYKSGDIKDEKTLEGLIKYIIQMDTMLGKIETGRIRSVDVDVHKEYSRLQALGQMYSGNIRYYRQSANEAWRNRKWEQERANRNLQNELRDMRQEMHDINMRSQGFKKTGPNEWIRRDPTTGRVWR